MLKLLYSSPPCPLSAIIAHIRLIVIVGGNVEGVVQAIDGPSTTDGRVNRIVVISTQRNLFQSTTPGWHFSDSPWALDHIAEFLTSHVPQLCFNMLLFFPFHISPCRIMAHLSSLIYYPSDFSWTRPHASPLPLSFGFLFKLVLPHPFMNPFPALKDSTLSGPLILRLGEFISVVVTFSRTDPPYFLGTSRKIVPLLHQKFFQLMVCWVLSLTRLV